ncbi:MAG TPA: hypothetical protein VGQ83_43655, partial [Polyangia bacterium]
MSDPSDRTPVPGQHKSPDPLGVAEDDWLAAVDEWDSKLDLGPDAPTAGATPALPPPLAAPEPPRPAPVAAHAPAPG